MKQKLASPPENSGAITKPLI